MTSKNNVIWVAMPLLLPAFQAADSQSPIPWWVWLVLILLALLVMMIILVRQQGSGEPIPPPEEQMKNLHAEAAPAARTATLAVDPATEESDETETETPSTTAEEGASSVDDLTRIEGIGPKTASLFKDAGITTFAKLAETDVAELDKILDDANMHFSDESSWPEQAKLADEGKWDELEKLQAELKGGRRT